MWQEYGKKPKALEEMPALDAELSYFIRARDQLATGEPIPYSEMNAYLVDYPEIEPKRFKVLLRAFDLALMAR